MACIRAHIHQKIRIDRKNAEEIGRLGIIQALEGRRVFEHLTAEENLNVGAYPRKDRRAVKRDLEMVYQYFPRLKALRRNVAGYLSGGEQQMLVIGRAMMAAPKLMMLDEPSIAVREEVKGACELLGLDPLYVANEGKLVAFVKAEDAERILAAMKSVASLTKCKSLWPYSP